MNETLKKRLVGAVVLVALAVIFVPFLLDGGQRSAPVSLSGSNVPEEPDYTFETIEIPLQVPEPEQAPDRRVVETAEEADTPPPAPAKVEGSVPEGTSTEPAQALPAKPSDLPGWVVQVASFSKPDNAVALRDKLREKGFAGFVEEVTNGGRKVYRVRVGPEQTRERAEQLVGRIERAVSLNGMVMKHP